MSTTTVVDTGDGSALGLCSEYGPKRCDATDGVRPARTATVAQKHVPFTVVVATTRGWACATRRGERAGARTGGRRRLGASRRWERVVGNPCGSEGRTMCRAWWTGRLKAAGGGNRDRTIRTGGGGSWPGAGPGFAASPCAPYSHHVHCGHPDRPTGRLNGTWRRGTRVL